MNGRLHLNPDLFKEMVQKHATREGFGLGILAAAKANKDVVAVTADLGGSTKLSDFKKQFPSRFVQVGVAEQDLVTVASGLAHLGKTPFATSFAVFSPGRNWEQIRTTVCYNDRPVKIVGSHAGIGVGEDGATHQMLEDIALMRVLPNMDVVVPCDAIQAKKATLALAKTKRPGYLRLTRQKSPLITTQKTPFVLGKAQVFRQGEDATVIACGPQVYDAMVAAERLQAAGIKAEVINLHTIKPLDVKAIVQSAKKTRLVVAVEDHQVNGGMGGAVAEALAEHRHTRMVRMGIKDTFGQSGKDRDLYKQYRLTPEDIVSVVRKALHG